MAMILTVVLLGAATVSSQSSATLRGIVLDASGATLGNATITVRNQTSGFDRSVITSEDGRYQVAAVPSAALRSDIDARHRPAVSAISGDAGSTRQLQLALNLGF